MRRTLLRWLALTGLTLAAGCAGGAAQSRSDAQTAYSRSLGLATLTDLRQQSQKVFSRNLFQVVREEQPPEVLIETQWKNRPPFDDEASAGAEAAMTRVILQARPSVSTGGIGETFRITMTVENMVRLSSGTDFERRPATPQFLEYATQLARELEGELKTGVRRP